MKKLLLMAVLATAIFGCSHKDPEPDPAPAPDPQHPVTVIQSPEGKQFYTGLLHKDEALRGLGEVHMQFAAGECDNLPDNFDLRDLGVVPSVKDQGQCGSCWAFSETGALESAMMAVGKTFDLAEQELVSCDRANWGCNGGLMNGFAYQINHGQGLESAFPYTSGRTGSNGACKTIPVAAKGIAFQIVGNGNSRPTEKEIRCAIYKYKTVPWITVSADGDWGSPPASEDTMWTRCSSGETNHAIGSVGWKKVGAKYPLIAKNSWGDWGDAGYALIPTGCDSFGEEVGFIQVEQPIPPGPTPTPTPPDPCVPPKIKLPMLMQVAPGTEVTLGVKNDPHWTMAWYVGSQKVGDGPLIYVTPSDDTVYRLTATSSCGQADSSVKVVLSLPKAKK